MRPYTLDIDPENTVADGLADGNSSAGATVTLDGALTSGGAFTSADGLGRRLTILDLGADDQTGSTYTITGTDPDGIAQTEAILGPGASAAVTTTKYFRTVTSITIFLPTVGSTVDIGTVDEARSATVPLNYRSETDSVHSVDVTGTINYTVNVAFQPLLGMVAPSQSLKWFAATDLAAQTADLAKTVATGATACQFQINSFTDTAEASYTVFQNEAS